VALGVDNPKVHIAGMMQDIQSPDLFLTRRLRLNTLIRLRWIAVTGQTVAVLIVAYWFGFPLPVTFCLGLIACSAWLNLLLTLRYPSTFRLGDLAALGILSFDVVQLAALLYVTGGLTNPFAVLLIVPVIISATSLPVRHTVMLGVVVAAMTTLLVPYHLPLPWFPGLQLAMPFAYVWGMWVAILSSLAFTAIYAWRVAEEARQLATALTATELVLQREQHLSALDGLAAAAAHELGTPLATISLVAKEMQLSLPPDSKLRDDVELLRSQGERCRDILKRLTSLSTEPSEHIARMPLTSLVEEVIAPYRDFGIGIMLKAGEREGPEPISRRNPGVIYGTGNLVENAVDFARTEVDVEWGWDAQTVWIRLTDDGPGFQPDIIDRIGEPYTTTRHTGEAKSAGGGLGLGLFIAKTLLGRSGATINFTNAGAQRKGACVTVGWPREAFEVAQPVI